MEGEGRNRTFTVEVDDGKYSLYAVVTVATEGLSVYTGGGEVDHIGSVAVSIPRESLSGSGESGCTTSVFNLTSHKDDTIAVPMAEEICRFAGETTVVTAGVHIDNAEEEELLRIIKNKNKLTEFILRRLLDSGKSKKK